MKTMWIFRKTIIPNPHKFDRSENYKRLELDGLTRFLTLKEIETKVGKECIIGMVYRFRQEIYGAPISRLVFKAKALTRYQKNLQISIYLCLC